MTVFTVLMCVGFTACSEEDKESSAPANPLVGIWDTDLEWWGLGIYTYTFKSDGTYTWNVGVYESGGGYYSHEDPYLTLSETGGGTSVWTIVTFEKNYFVVMTQSGSTYTFYKSDGAKAEKMDVSGTVQSHDYVNLGLSVKWATCNVGASVPEEEGDYYAWGETSTKSDYSWDTYKWCKNGWDDHLTKYCSDSRYGYYIYGEYTDEGVEFWKDVWQKYRFTDDLTTLEPADDVATVKWGNKWRMPTKEEIEELCDKCTWTWIQRNGYNGHKVTGPNGKSIFLPAAGYRDGTEVNNRGSNGNYWSGTLDEVNSDRAYYLYFGSDYHDWGSDSRNYGHTVRPVTE